MVLYLVMNYLYWEKVNKRLGLSHSSAEVNWAPAALLCPGLLQPGLLMEGSTA